MKGLHFVGGRVLLTAGWMVPMVPRLFGMRFDKKMLLSSTPSGWAPNPIKFLCAVHIPTSQVWIVSIVVE